MGRGGRGGAEMEQLTGSGQMQVHEAQIREMGKPKAVKKGKKGKGNKGKGGATRITSE